MKIQLKFNVNGVEEDITDPENVDKPPSERLYI